jgi:alpha-glucoside transport system permease protein
MAAITPESEVRSDKEFDYPRLLLALLMLAGTLFIFWYGFVFFRDNSIRSDTGEKALIVLLAIIWGVGGFALFFWVVDFLIESLPLVVRVAIQPYFFVGPAVALLIAFLAYPAFRTLLLSFRDQSGNEFVGLANYTAFFEPGNVMLMAFRNNLLWVVFGATASIIAGLLIAVLADRSSYEKVAKSLIFLPMAISLIGAAVIWRFIYEVRSVDQAQIGLFNAIVKGLGFKPQAWTTQIWINELYANLPSWLSFLDGRISWINNLFLIIIVVWLQTGFAMVLFSAALKGIPEDLMEAARVDGATESQIFFRIMVPYIRGTIITVSTTVVIFTLKVFDVVWAMTGGNYDTEVIGTQFYRQNFVLRNQGFGSAIAIILLIAVIPVMIYNLKQFNENEAF